MDKDISALATNSKSHIFHNLADSNQLIDEHIGSKLKSYRVELGYSKAALAKRLDIPLQQLQKYESGRGKISASRLVILASSLGVKTSFFLPDLETIACGQTANIKKLHSACEHIANAKLRDAIMGIIDIAKKTPVKS